MGSRLNLVITFAAILLFAWMGLPSFSVCHANGGNILSCGLVAFLIGAVKTVLIVYLWFWALLIDGLAHVFAR